MNGWIITTIAFVILTFVFALLAGSQFIEVRFEKRRTAAHRALTLNMRDERDHWNGMYTSLRQQFSEADEKHVALLVQFDALKGENITLQARVADLEEVLAEAQKTVPVAEAPKPPRRKRTEAP